MGYIEKLIEDIKKLKRERNAVILAHNYQIPEVQEVADYVGDSLELARKSMEVDADVIVFAGVSFMAELTAVMNPDKKVLHPEPCSRCPLADCLKREHIREFRSRYPNAPLVLYVNSPTELKAEADYIVTSASALKLVSKLENDTVLFGPDKNLAGYVSEKTGKNVVAVPPDGHCPVHEYLLSRYYVERAIEKYPRGTLIIHPEAPKDARQYAHYIGSTSQMLKAIGEIEAETYIIGTEEGLVYRARKLYPNKHIVPANPAAVCIDMKKINLLNIKRSLEALKPEVKIDPDIARKVREVVERSLEMIR